jgi:SAGA-associated factor 29
MTLDDRLESLYRENVKISEEVSHIIDGNSDDMSLLDSIKILAGLREASEESLHASRSHSSNSKGRNATLKRKAGSMDVDDEASGMGSPRPGPRQGTQDRLAVEGKSRERNRERSVTSTREVSVKLEDRAESVASSVEGKFPLLPLVRIISPKANEKTSKQTNQEPVGFNSASAPTSSTATKAALRKAKAYSAASQT